MSYDPCKYCSNIAFKSDGNGDLICYNRANTGDCEIQPPTQTINHNSFFRVKKIGNEPCICGSGKKSKNCKCKNKLK